MLRALHYNTVRLSALAGLMAAFFVSGAGLCCYSANPARNRWVGPRGNAEAGSPLPTAAPVERPPSPTVPATRPTTGFDVRVRLTGASFPATVTADRALTLTVGAETRRVEAGTPVRLRLDRGIMVDIAGRPWQATGDTVFIRPEFYRQGCSSSGREPFSAQRQEDFESERHRPVEPGLVSFGDRRYRGAMLAFRDREGGLALVNELDIEDYLSGVVPCEIGPINEQTAAAVKAQAVAARSFTLTRLEARRGLGHSLFDTYRRDQEYRGAGSEVALARRLVLETAGEVLLWEGAPLVALYHANCGGRTMPGTESPALRSVHDTPDGRAGRPWCADGRHYSWTVEFGREEFERKLAAAAKRSDRVRVRDFSIERDESGRARRLVFRTDRGDLNVSGPDFRFGLGLKSTLLEIEAGPRTVKITGRGWGHGAGLCQEGAIAMARAGRDYRAILKQYYPAATIGRRD